MTESRNPSVEGNEEELAPWDEARIGRSISTAIDRYREACWISRDTTSARQALVVAIAAAIGQGDDTARLDWLERERNYCDAAMMRNTTITLHILDHTTVREHIDRQIRYAAAAARAARAAPDHGRGHSA
jgi:hypothetical protein